MPPKPDESEEKGQEIDINKIITPISKQKPNLVSILKQTLSE